MSHHAPGQRFPAWLRVRQRSEFERVYQGGRKCVRRFLVLYACQNIEAESPTRLGLTVSRKVGGAVVRNLMKRRLRALFRIHHRQIAPGWTLIFNTRVSAATASYAALEGDFLACVRGMNLWTGETKPGEPGPPMASPPPPSSSPDPGSSAGG